MNKTFEFSGSDFDHPAFKNPRDNSPLKNSLIQQKKKEKSQVNFKKRAKLTKKVSKEDKIEEKRLS